MGFGADDVKIYHGASLPTYQETVSDIEKQCPYVQIERKAGVGNSRVTKFYRDNLVEKNSKAYVSEYSDGSFIVRTNNGTSLHGKYRRTEALGCVKDGIFHWVEDTNYNQKMDSGEVFYYRKENEKDLLGIRTLLF